MKKRKSFISTILFIFVLLIAFTFSVVQALPHNTATLSGRHHLVEKTKKIEKETVNTDYAYPVDNEKKYIGVYVDDPDTVNTVYQNSVNTIGWYVDLSQEINCNKKLEQSLDQHLFTAFITLEPTNMSLNEIANGAYDDKFNEFFTKLTENGRSDSEIFVRFAHEMEMRPNYASPWYSWQGWDSDAYIRAWRHVIDLGHKNAPNIKWVWSPNRADAFAQKYYPGDDYVDYVGLTLNNTTDGYSCFEEFYASVGTQESLETYNKPIFISECAEYSEDENLKNQYISSVFDYIKKDSNIVGVVFLDKDISSDRAYKFSDNAEQLNTFISRSREITEKE